MQHLTQFKKMGEGKVPFGQEQRGIKKRTKEGSSVGWGGR